MSETLSRSQHLFIVRIWSDAKQLSQTHYRGSVEHVSTGQKFYFTSLNDLSDFIVLKATVWSQPISTRKEPGQ